MPSREPKALAAAAPVHQVDREIPRFLALLRGQEPWRAVQKRKLVEGEPLVSNILQAKLQANDRAYQCLRLRRKELGCVHNRT